MAADAQETTTPGGGLLRRMLIAGGLLAVFAIVGAGLVALTENATRERIAANERAFLLLAVGYPAEDATVPDITRKPPNDVIQKY